MQIYYSRATEFSEDDAALLSDARIEKLGTLKTPLDRMMCVAVGKMLIKIFGERHNEIEIAEGGKPYLKGGPEFSISHSGEYAVVAVDECEIGVDIEKVFEPPKLVAERFFSKDEYEWFLNLGCDEDFFRIWTAKESLLKKIGTGIRVPMASFSVLPIENGFHRVGVQEVFFNWITVGDHIICVCSENNGEPQIIKAD